MNNRARPHRGAPAAGFTLLEAVVALAVMTVVLIGLLSLLQVNSRIAKAQVNVADMQQSLRVVQADMVRQARMAGRGGLPVFYPRFEAGGYNGMYLPTGVAIAVRNNVEADVFLGEFDSARVAEGTDVLTLRGVFNTPLYQVNPRGDGDIRGAKAAGEGAIIVRSKSPTGVPQELEWLTDLGEEPLPEALLLVSAGSDAVQAVVELARVVDNGDGSVTVGFTITDDYGKLSPRGEFPSALRTVAMFGILEEYRYYVRDEAPAPRLSRARFYPGTENEYANDTANLHVDVADNILDLQVALGIDRAPEGIQDTGGGEDDWLFNSPDDPKPTEDPDAWNGDALPLDYLRITTLARTDRLDPDYLSPPIAAIEDHVYGETAAPAADEILERRYRRRLLQTMVDLRNLS